jgi:YHYH protein
MHTFAACTAAMLVLAALAYVAANQPGRSDPKKNLVSFRVEGKRLVVQSNGIADHESGWFPNANNPFRIQAQSHHFTLPLDPKENATPTAMFVTQFGIALNGVPLDPAGSFFNGDPRSGWQFDPLHPAVGAHLGVDQNNAHTQPGGAYHYHGLPQGLYARLQRAHGGETSRMILVGWAADGFPIYGPYGHADATSAASALRPMESSYRLKPGDRPQPPSGTYDGSFIQDYEYVPGLGDLDECNGRFGVTPEFPKGIYHYHLTYQLPVVPRMFRGTPDKSFEPPGGGPGPGEVPPGLKNFPHIDAPRS